MMRYKIPTLVLILPIGSRKVYPGKKCCWKILGNALALFEVTGGKFAHHCWRRPSKNVAMTFFLFMMKIVRHVIGSTADFSTFFPSFLASGRGYPLCVLRLSSEFSSVRYAGFEPGTTALPLSHHISFFYLTFLSFSIFFLGLSS